MMWVALRETLFILEALRKSLLHNRTNPCQDWRFPLVLVTFGAYFYTWYTNRRWNYARKMYQITHRDQNDTQNTMKIHNDWLRPAKHLDRWCIENKIIIAKKKKTHIEFATKIAYFEIDFRSRVILLHRPAQRVSNYFSRNCRSQEYGHEPLSVS